MRSAERPNGSEWAVVDHRGTVRVRYRVFGDTTDGTFLGVDSSHAHINIPAGGNAVNWKPARDFARYYGVRASVWF